MAGPRNDAGELIDDEPKVWIEAKMMLAYARLRNNQVDEAIEDFKFSDNLDTREEYPGIHDGLGQCYHR